MDILDSPTRI